MEVKPGIGGRVHWEALSDDDFVCVLDHVCLRVEQMSANDWWWCFSVGGTEVAGSYITGPFAKREKTAKDACAQAYFNWKEKQ